MNENVLVKIGKMRIIHPVSNDGEMCYGSLPSEFEVQSYIYSTLKRMGYDIRGEVTSRCKTCRFDLVIFHEKIPKMIIEVKKKRKKPRQARNHMKSQVKRYTQFGCLFVVCTGMNQAIDLCNEIDKYVSRY